MKNSEYKEIIDKIVKEEKEEHNLDFDIHFIGKLTYFKKMNEIKKKKLSLDERIVEMIFLLNAGGFQNTKSNLIVIFSNYLKKKLFLSDITKFVFSVYHEIHHAIVAKVASTDIDISNYDNLSLYVDQYRIERSVSYYFNPAIHDSMYYEILADKYAVEKTREFFNKNKQYKLNEKYFQRKNDYVKQRYESYNLSKKLDIVIDNYQNPEEDDIIFDIFLNSDGSYKNLDEIRSYDKFNTLDTKIIKSFLTTKAFKDSLDLTKISDDSKQYLLNLYDVNPKTSKKLNVQKHIKYYEVYPSLAIGNFCIIIESIILTQNTIKCLENPQLQSDIPRLLIGLIITDSYLLYPIIRKIREKYKINVEEKEMVQLINELQRNIENNEVKKI